MTDNFSFDKKNSDFQNGCDFFARKCIAFIQDKKERGYDAKDILDELEDFLHNCMQK